MLRHLLKLIWKKKKQNFMLISEILISFMVLFAVFTFGIFCYTNYKMPVGIEYQDVWVVNYKNPLTTSNKDSLTQFYEILKQNIKSIPQVKEVTYTSDNVPFSDAMITTSKYYNKFQIKTNQFLVDENYTKTLGIKLLEGRWYSKQDKSIPGNVVVINNVFKEKAFGSESAIGKLLFDYSGMNPVKVIGVLDDVKFKSEYQPADESIYTLYDSSAYQTLGKILIKTDSGVEGTFEGTLFKTITASLKNANVDVEYLPNKLVSANKVVLIPLIILSVIAGFLIINVALGIFGVLWYNINKRRGEIGLRMAIGATGKAVSKQLVFESLLMATFALVIGIILAIQFPLANVFGLPSLIYMIALIFALLVIYLLVFICSLYPGRQAAKIYPAIALHEE